MGNITSKKASKKKSASPEKEAEQLTALQIEEVQQTWKTVSQDLQGTGVKFFVRLGVLSITTHVA